MPIDELLLGGEEEGDVCNVRGNRCYHHFVSGQNGKPILRKRQGNESVEVNV